MNTLVDELNNKFLKNIIPGQEIIFVNKNFNSQVNKVSLYNPNSIIVDYLDQENFGKINKNFIINKNDNFNNDNNTNFNDNNLFPIMEISRENVTNLIQGENSLNIGFKSFLYKNKNVPIKTNSKRQIFSTNALNFSMTIEKNKNLEQVIIEKYQKQGKKIIFEMRFDIPHGKDLDETIKNTSCIQFDSSKNPTFSCESWYDNQKSQVVCLCEKFELTVNLMDEILADSNKLMQFPLIKNDTCK